MNQEQQNKLDNLNYIKKIDKQDMAKFIKEMPEQIEKVINKARKLKLPFSFSKNIEQIVFCGMGGSALASHLIVNLPAEDRKIPIKVIRDYDIPAWVNKNTLVVLSSHSGQTQETISAFLKAVHKKAKIFIVAERGKIEKLGDKYKAIVFDYDTPAPPRASLGYQFGAIFELLTKLKIINYNIQPGLKILKKLNAELEPQNKSKNNLAKKLALSCFNHLPIIVASGILKSVAWRWKTQLNENSKSFAFTEFLPEAMHNAIQGFDFPEDFKDQVVYLILENSFNPVELNNQLSKFKKVLNNKKIGCEIIKPIGKDIFSQKLSLVLLGDWVSFYLSVLNKINPTPVKIIEKQKK